MIHKYVFGKPFPTEAVVTEVPAAEGEPAYGTIETKEGFCFTYVMEDTDIVYGLGEANRGLNKRGYGWGRQTAASISVAMSISATARTNPTTQRTSVLCTEHTILS